MDFLDRISYHKLPCQVSIHLRRSIVWLNFEELGLDAKELEKFLSQKAQLALNSGYWFGREGAGYARMNIACPQSILQEALLRLTNAVRNHL